MLSDPLLLGLLQVMCTFLADTDYMSKWAEAVALNEVKKENVVDLIRTHIIY